MPQIQSPREVDQLYHRVAQKLVRRSNALESDYTSDVPAELRRVINAMHRRMPGAFAKVRWIGAGDGYGVTGPNAINTMREIVPGSGDATQGTAGNQPPRSRDDDQQNLATHSTWPGVLGATEPDGWTSTAAGTGAAEGEIVASDDGSDSHQAWEAPALTDERRFLQQSMDVVQGMRIIVACRYEANNYTGGNGRGVFATGVSLTQLGTRALADLTDGEWAWVAFDVDASGTLAARAGPGCGSNASHDAGTRISRPVAAHLPPLEAGGPDLSGTDAEVNTAVQAWLDDHYATSGSDHEEFAGYRGMRGIVIPDLDGKHLVGPTINPGGDGWTEFSLAVFTRPRAWPDASQRPFCQGSNQRGIFMTSSQGLRFQWQDAGSNVFNAGSFSLDTARVNVPRLWTGTAKIDDPLRLYQDETEVAASAAIPSFVDNSGSIDISDGTLPYLGDAFWEFVFQRQLTASEVATLHSIITDT